MKIKKTSVKNVKVLSLPSREAWILVSGHSLGAKAITLIEVHIKPEEYTSPVHAHTECEEVIYVKEGVAEIWIEGNLGNVEEGEAALIPTGAKHAVKNIGASKLKLLTVYPSSDHRKGFVEHKECKISEWE